MAVVAKAASFLPAVGFSRSREPSCSVRSGSALCLRAGVRRKNLKQFGGKVSCGALLKASSFSAASSSFQGRLFLVVTCPSDKAGKGTKNTGVQASLLGVGAPEALVIGVVALLVFGPKGLAEVARTLGKTLRGFQPAIKELQEVSREFKATLEQEIGLDELRNTSYDSPPTSSPSRPPSSTSASSVSSTPSTIAATEAPAVAPKSEEAPVQPKPYTTDDYMRLTEEQTQSLVLEEMRKASEAAAWEGSPPVKPVAETSIEEQSQSSASANVDESTGATSVGSTPTKPLE
ncbi:uncharacterized protein [Physcomitrium patens]|uniref:Sec-independent protein translocase protein TATB, chloroplastic n=1 Tax=Physcomitrium patens TaxID=3218 RepID=A9U0H1_PHYPA|nr:sec-independent protein translocase protein TATB, chloroplastic-like isoform X1 [Physcomitrium patens]PNR37585.1 hypothetical protein PHYPA_020694 [Physcomitrium patens]|eukprot:XP_024398673.1 sec-independent protein translocase protein TATB, chloroplastic-like isoform X1 [Physcomitrella patens]